MLSALQSDQIGKIGVGVIIGLVVIGLLLSMIITKLIGRLVILIVVVALGAFVWQQRSSVLDNVCNKSDLTFAGIHVKVPADVQAQCKDAVSKVK
jgi:hypothetical protein